MIVTCLYVHGEYPYTPDYVTRLYDMVARWMDRPFQFVALTDQPWLFQAPIETVPIVKLHGSAPWTKLELFSPRRGWQEQRVLYLDLDVLIVAPLQPIVDFPATFAITDDPATKQRRRRPLDRFSRTIVRRFNSSVMVWDGGTHTEFRTDWTPAQADRLSGDQDYLGDGWPELATMPRAWFPRLSELSGPPWGDAKVILAKVPKNAIAVNLFPWFAPLWGAA